MTTVPPGIGRAVLIDLDGTLVDTAEDIAAAANAMLADLGTLPLPSTTVRGFIGKGVRNLVRCSLEATGLHTSISVDRAEALFNTHYKAINGSLSRVYPGIMEGLRALRAQGYQLGCVTNKPHALAAPLLALTGLDAYIEVLVAGDSLKQMKPDPEPLRHACRQLSVEPANTVLVGDSEVDSAAARAARMPVYLVTYGYSGPNGPHALPCDGLLTSLEELPFKLASERVHAAVQAGAQAASNH